MPNVSMDPNVALSQPDVVDASLADGLGRR